MPSADEENENEADEENSSDGISKLDLNFVVGDVTKPIAGKLKKNDESEKLAIIVHCVDNSGKWGTGGLFTAIAHRFPEVPEQYETSAKCRDLRLGDAHLIQERKENKVKIILAVAQSSTKYREVQLGAFDTALKRIAAYAAQQGATVHFPRIGYGKKKFLKNKRFSSNFSQVLSK